MRSSTRILFAITGAVILVSVINAVSVSNLSRSCLRCICWASTNCSITITGKGGYAGPFWISRVYWSDAGNHTLAYDDPQRDNAYADCAKQYECAAIIVTNYMQRYGKDCTGDGVTNCDDYARLHYLGDYGCDVEISSSNFGKRYEQCRKIALSANPLLDNFYVA